MPAAGVVVATTAGVGVGITSIIVTSVATSLRKRRVLIAGFSI